MKKLFSLVMAAAIALCVLAHPAHVSALTVAEAQQVADQVVAGSGLSVHPQGIDSAGQPGFQFVGPESEDLSIDIDPKLGVVRYFYWGRRMIESRVVRFSLAQALANAEKWLRENHINRDDSYLPLRSELIDHGLGGIEYLFVWTKVVDGIHYPSAMFLDASAATGEVVGFQWVDHPVTLKNLKPAFSAEQAMQAVRDKSKKSWSGDAHLVITSQQVLQWSVRLVGQEETEYTPERGQSRVEKFLVADVDAQTGVVQSFQVGWLKDGKRVRLRPPVPTPRSNSVVQFWPSWRDGGRSFGYWQWTEQEAAAQPRKSGSYRSKLIGQEGSLSSLLLASPSFIITNPAWSDRSQRVAFGDRGGTLYVLDLKSGSIGRLYDPERVSQQMPAWDSQGRQLALSSTHSGSDDFEEDIFVTRVQDKLSAVSGRDLKCVAALAGRDTLPVWTPDDKNILFAHQESDSSGAGAWSMYRVRSDLSRLAKDYEPPKQIVAGLLAEPERLSLFPDGLRVLISYSGNDYGLKHPPQVLDIAAKSLRSLRWPVLHDPDLPKGQPLIPRELVVSPDGQRVAFSAQRWSGNTRDEGAVCLYTCKLDGSDLKRATSPASTSPQVHQYPQPGITALNAWEKLQPKPNLGVLTSPYK